jgi:predicted DNA-binding WGR domain protein
MNFGPINQRGGEKRLNVIFSRARHHMVVVSSIRHYDITNEYNDGASCLRNFLEYSFAASSGDDQTVQRILSLKRESLHERMRVDTVTEQISSLLKQRGYDVMLNHGQSSFRCDIAAKNPEENDYRLAIFVDTEEHYRIRDLPERYLFRMQILRSFGWQPLIVLTKDWYTDREDVIKRIERMLKNPELDDEVPTDPSDSISALPEVAVETKVHEEEKQAKIEIVHTANEQLHPISQTQLKPLQPEVPISAHRYLEFVGGNSRKFWEVTVKGTIVYVRFGRIGTKGQTQIKSFDTETAAEHEAQKLIREKVNKGYADKINQ